MIFDTFLIEELPNAKYKFLLSNLGCWKNVFNNFSCIFFFYLLLIIFDFPEELLNEKSKFLLSNVGCWNFSNYFQLSSWPNKTEPQRLSSWSLQRRIKCISFSCQTIKKGYIFSLYHNNNDNRFIFKSIWIWILTQ